MNEPTMISYQVIIAVTEMIDDVIQEGPGETVYCRFAVPAEVMDDGHHGTLLRVLEAEIKISTPEMASLILRAYKKRRQ